MNHVSRVEADVYTPRLLIYVFQKLKLLVRNLGLAWHEGLFPEAHDMSALEFET